MSLCIGCYQACFAQWDRRFAIERGVVETEVKAHSLELNKRTAQIGIPHRQGVVYRGGNIVAIFDLRGVESSWHKSARMEGEIRQRILVVKTFE